MASDSTLVQISSLPVTLTHDEAVEAAYRTELDAVWAHLSTGVSVLIRCDKQLSNYLYKSIRRRARQSQGITLKMLSGQPKAADPTQPEQRDNSTLMQRLLAELRESVSDASSNTKVLVLPHLDVLTTTSKSSLGMEAREVAAIMYENPDLTFLSFQDPDMELHPTIAKVFTSRLELSGVPRSALPALVTQREARKFGVESFDAFGFYKYTSGLNPVRFRQVMESLRGRVDFDPAAVGANANLYADLRALTCAANLEIPKVELDTDLAGYPKVKAQLREELLDLLARKNESKSAEEIKQIESLVPRGMIFEGPPGTGKTFFAKAIATAINATVTVVSGPEMKSKWVGESEENLRRVFREARQNAPAIIIFDEIDSFATARGSYTGSGVEHSMVNQLLTEMDGFRKDELVFVVATTNFAESLDPALLRPGRFELILNIPYPTRKDRKAIMEVYNRKFQMGLSEAIIEYAVLKTNGYSDPERGLKYSGDHLNALCRGLKREMLRRNIKGEDLTEKEVDKVLDPRRDSAKFKSVLTAEERKVVALHEAGHAILCYVLPHIAPPKRITVDIDADAGVSFLGYVMRGVSERHHITAENSLRDSICVAMGGRVAERIKTGSVSTGCSNDLQQATAIATAMVERLGMDPEVGPMALRKPQDDARARMGGLTLRDLSESSMKIADEAIRKILKDEEERATTLLTTFEAEHQALTEALLVKGTMGLEDLKALFDGREFKAEGYKKIVDTGEEDEDDLP
jgi:cell division protease FtsH